MLLGKCTTPVMRCNDGLMAGFNTFEKKKRKELHYMSHHFRVDLAIPFFPHFIIEFRGGVLYLKMMGSVRRNK